MGIEAGRARSGVQRKPDRHSVWFGAFWLGRRPLRPQGGAGLGEPAVRRLHACRRLLDQPRPDVLAAAACGPRHRRRYSQCRSPSIPSPRRANCARRLRLSLLGACRSAAPFRLRRRRARAAIWLADPVSDRRHRADRHRHRCADRHAGIDQVHGAARKPARQDGAFDHGHQSWIPGVAQRQIRHRGRTAVSRASIRPTSSAKGLR